MMRELSSNDSGGEGGGFFACTLHVVCAHISYI